MKTMMLGFAVVASFVVGCGGSDGGGLTSPAVQDGPGASSDAGPGNAADSAPGPVQGDSGSPAEGDAAPAPDAAPSTDAATPPGPDAGEPSPDAGTDAAPTCTYPDMLGGSGVAGQCGHNCMEIQDAEHACSHIEQNASYAYKASCQTTYYWHTDATGTNPIVVPMPHQAGCVEGNINNVDPQYQGLYYCC